MTYKELKKAYHFYEDECDEKSRDISYYTCPNCGYAVRSISTNSLKCGGCGKVVIIQYGKVKGWR